MSRPTGPGSVFWPAPGIEPARCPYRDCVRTLSRELGSRRSGRRRSCTSRSARARRVPPVVPRHDDRSPLRPRLLVGTDVAGAAQGDRDSGRHGSRGDRGRGRHREDPACGRISGPWPAAGIAHPGQPGLRGRVGTPYSPVIEASARGGGRTPPGSRRCRSARCAKRPARAGADRGRGRAEFRRATSQVRPSGSSPGSGTPSPPPPTVRDPGCC